ncbi:pyruvate dehydrogenase E2 component (dihydrolipoamide acetyltransferase) [Streptomyces sp. WMMB 714]|uniref:dihydrolipoamide acetyltransferase family protein n=1 Tax=Streptomyces sp. WMMB 714 TaxID=1286822 RepID=UPI0005F83164|nr:dihydrolipoamide acetyltransferase family protein [Streptomyces sp. WMMB 714]SCK23495.1 pyruvate dehydrogenase E2 component (dihydrolipoamide acetyltransferase) [Streptomyces sp. WMMB 714]
MASVREFNLPDLGEGLTEATVVRWMVAVGDVVAVDQPVVEVETAKALVEVPCPYGGVVTARYGDEGAELPVGAPLLSVAVGASEEAGANGAAGSAGPAGSKSAADGSEGSDGSGNVLVGYGTAGSAGRRRRTRPVDGFHLADGKARGGVGTALPASPPAQAEPPAKTAQAAQAAPVEPSHPTPRQGPVAVISPLVRRLAREHGLDLRGIPGSGPEGLILRADVERAARSRADAAPVAYGTADGTAAGAAGAAPQQAAQTTGRAPTRIPLTGFRGTVADKLSRSRREIPDATCWVDADATELLAARRAMNDHGAAHGTGKVSLLALLARVCTAALSRFPELNSTVDTDAREVLRHPDVHVGFAAQTPRGLVVPVVRDAHALDADGLTAEMSRLTESARQGTLTPREMTGGTFTLNNYGVFGVDGSTPIINHPESAMLGVGRITEKPWVVDGQLAVRHVVQLSLTFDHRVCDGGTAGGFLRYVADCVEHPAVLLRTL